MGVVGFGGGCSYLTCLEVMTHPFHLDYSDLFGMTLVRAVEGDEGIETSQHPPPGKSGRLVQRCQSLLIEDPSGGKSTKAHVSGSKAMGQGQGKVILTGQLSMFLSSSIILQPTVMLDSLQRQMGPDLAKSYGPW